MQTIVQSYLRLIVFFTSWADIDKRSKLAKRMDDRITGKLLCKYEISDLSRRLDIFLFKCQFNNGTGISIILMAYVIMHESNFEKNPRVS